MQSISIELEISYGHLSNSSLGVIGNTFFKDKKKH
jgi:hypothetical protein